MTSAAAGLFTRHARRRAWAVVLVVGVAGLAACTQSPGPTPTPTPVEPTPTGPTLDPEEPFTEFALPTGTQVEVNGVVIEALDGISGPGTPGMSLGLSGAGFDDVTVRGDVGDVTEIPGWGLFTVVRVEGDPVTAGGGRPPTILHFRAQTDEPLVFTSTFSLGADYGRLRLGGSSTEAPTGLSIEVIRDGAEDGVAAFAVSPPTGGGDIDVQGPPGTVVEVPEWGTITVIETDPEVDEVDGPLRIRTETAFVVIEGS